VRVDDEGLPIEKIHQLHISNLLIVLHSHYNINIESKKKEVINSNFISR
jgi:hypothetical protein